MQALKILSLTDYKLEALASKIPEMKHVSISSINSTLTKLRSFTHNFWSPIEVKLVSAIGTPATVLIILFISITLYCKLYCNGCVHEHIRPVSVPFNNTHIELDPITNLLPDPSGQLSPQIFQEIFKASDVDLLKFQHYKLCKKECQTATQVTKV